MIGLGFFLIRRAARIQSTTKVTTFPKKLRRQVEPLVPGIDPGDLLLKVWEVDHVYVTDGSAFAGCVCVPEKYEVYVFESTNAANPGKYVKLSAVAYDSANSNAGHLSGWLMGTGAREGAPSPSPLTGCDPF